MILLARLCKMCHDFIWEIKWKEERLKCLNYADLDCVYPVRNDIGQKETRVFLGHQMFAAFNCFQSEMLCCWDSCVAPPGARGH